VRRWNGGGPRSYNHQKKVQIMQEMLRDPLNKEVFQMYQSMLEAARWR